MSGESAADKIIDPLILYLNSIKLQGKSGNPLELITDPSLGHLAGAVNPLIFYINSLSKEEDKSLLGLAMKPYFLHTKYAVSVLNYEFPRIDAEFSIPFSCYVVGTGHFNGPEALLAYNQIAYGFFARAIEERQEDVLRVTNGLTLETFTKEGQLPRSFVTSVNELKFRKPIDPKKFYGSFEAKKIAKVGAGGNAFFTTDVKFWDDYGGKSSGRVTLAFENFSGGNSSKQNSP